MPSVEKIFQKIVFRQISQISTFSPLGRNSSIWELRHVLFLDQGANALLLVPRMPTLKQSSKISISQKIKKGCGHFCISANLRWFKVCFLSSWGQYASFGTPHAFFQKIVIRKISLKQNFKISNFRRIKKGRGRFGMLKILAVLDNDN